MTTKISISNPNLIFYACVSKGNTILAEFNSKDEVLATLAAKCLEKTPPLHITFSHTVRNRTHTFLIDEPFVYFAIYDESVANSEALSFLRRVKEEFNRTILAADDVRSRENLNSHCFQGEFNPVFHQLLSSPAAGLRGPHSPPAGGLQGPISPSPESVKLGPCSSLDSPRGKRMGSVPLLGGESAKRLMKKKKKKRISAAESNHSPSANDGLSENKVDVSDDPVILSRDLSTSMQKNGFLAAESPAHQKAAKRVWKRHVWVVLTLDLIVCCILFGVWLWVCRGFKCIHG